MLLECKNDSGYYNTQKAEFTELPQGKKNDNLNPEKTNSCYLFQ